MHGIGSPCLFLPLSHFLNALSKAVARVDVRSEENKVQLPAPHPSPSAVVLLIPRPRRSLASMSGPLTKAQKIEMDFERFEITSTVRNEACSKSFQLQLFLSKWAFEGASTVRNDPNRSGFYCSKWPSTVQNQFFY